MHQLSVEAGVEPYLTQVHSYFDIVVRQSSSYIHTIPEQTGRIKVHLDSSLHKYQYSKHPHIRTLILEVRLIRFLYIGCLVKNQPEGVLKLFLKIGGGNQNCNKYTKKSLRLN